MIDIAFQIIGRYIKCRHKYSLHLYLVIDNFVYVALVFDGCIVKTILCMWFLILCPSIIEKLIRKMLHLKDVGMQKVLSLFSSKTNVIATVGRPDRPMCWTTVGFG